MSFEIALVAALALNWRAPRRRMLLLTGLGVHIVMRVWTLLYFVPEITQFMATDPNSPSSPELADRVARWERWAGCVGLSSPRPARASCWRS